MKARDIMTTDIVSVPPAMPAAEIARLLDDTGISAVPVIGEDGAALGMVAEADLTGRPDDERAEKIMTAPLLTVTEETGLTEIARLLTEHSIKRVPVVRGDKVVGIVSRADLVRAFPEAVPDTQPDAEPGLFARMFVALEEHFAGAADKPPAELPESKTDTAPPEPEAADFQHLIEEHEHDQQKQREEQRKTAEEQRRRKVEELIETHVDDTRWQGLMQQAREAASAGRTEFQLLRFPSQLCSDGGRAINVAESGWPETLRGEAAELYRRWDRDLKPHGFRLTARILDFPDGFPGDAGLFLTWGQ